MKTMKTMMEVISCSELNEKRTLPAKKMSTETKSDCETEHVDSTCFKKLNSRNNFKQIIQLNFSLRTFLRQQNHICFKVEHRSQLFLNVRTEFNMQK